jgi:hypothetical protein
MVKNAKQGSSLMTPELRDAEKQRAGEHYTNSRSQEQNRNADSRDGAPTMNSPDSFPY